MCLSPLKGKTTGLGRCNPGPASSELPASYYQYEKQHSKFKEATVHTVKKGHDVRINLTQRSSGVNKPICRTCRVCLSFEPPKSTVRLQRSALTRR